MSYLSKSLTYLQANCKHKILQNESILKFYKSAYWNQKRGVVVFQIRKGYDSESKTFRLPVELLKKLDVLATENKLSLNQLVIQCLTYAVENLDVEADE